MYGRDRADIDLPVGVRRPGVPLMADAPVPLPPIAAGSAPARRAVLARRIRLLVAATIAYNVVEAVVAITAGTIASSTALVGFGFDSVIEVSSAAGVAWQFAFPDPRTRERVALRVIAVSFYNAYRGRMENRIRHRNGPAASMGA